MMSSESAGTQHLPSPSPSLFFLSIDVPSSTSLESAGPLPPSLSSSHHLSLLLPRPLCLPPSLSGPLFYPQSTTISPPHLPCIVQQHPAVNARSLSPRLPPASMSDSPVSYEGRCGLPTNFDSTYYYALGYVASALLHSGNTGLISSVGNLVAPVEQLTVGGTALTSLMDVERRHATTLSVILIKRG